MASDVEGAEPEGLAAAHEEMEEGEEQQEEEQDAEDMDEDEGDENVDEDDDEYEYVYDDGDGDDDNDCTGGGGEGSSSSTRPSTVPLFTGLDTIGCTNDMLLKKELTRIKGDIEKSRRWRCDMTWAEESRTLGVKLEHETFIKANLQLTFPGKYPHEPPKFRFIGPRFDDTVDFVLGAETFEPCRKENWNDTFTCTTLLMIVMELVKDKYPITDELVFDAFEQTLIQICRSRLPGVPRKVKEGMIYFGVRMEPKDKGTKRSSGVGYSNGGRESHDFSLHDAKFKEQLEGLQKFLEMTKEATSVQMARIQHIHFAAWLLRYLEEELPIFSFEQVHALVRQAVDLVSRVESLSNEPPNEEVERIRQVFQIREDLIRPAQQGRLVAAPTDYVLPAIEDEFERHHYKNEGSVTPSVEVMKRVMLELENLKDILRGMTDGQIFVVFSEASCLLWKVIMIPSSGTPYFGGCFEFHLAIPPDYPNKPPKCSHMTTGGGQVRFNPNLYGNSKICLSLLGTWQGEPWDPAHSNLSQLFISILAFIFTTEPLRNEPGLEASPDKTIRFYNAYLRLETAETAMIGQLTKPPSEFADVIKRHFKRNWAPLIRPDLVAWAEKYNFDESESSHQSVHGQINRISWFRQALGAGNYKKMMMSIVHRLDELVDGIRGGAGIEDGGVPQGKSAAGAAASSAAAGPAVAVGGGASKPSASGK